MIGMLRGRVWEIQSEKLILDVQGVGYLVSAPLGILAKLQPGLEAVFYTHVIIREEEMTLYGFASLAEKELFLQMLSVSGIGPKAALAILSTLGTAQAASAIGGENLTVLTQVPGIGKKTAQRLILELKEKFKNRVSLGESGPQGSQEQAPLRSEAMETLLALGFNQEEAKKALGSLADRDSALPVEEEVRLALKALANRK